jgi:hypothetical protein
MPELQVLNGALQWKTVRIAGARFVIGRKDGCDLVLQDGWASREHTLIFEPRPGEYFVKDLGSENGTYLNGERLTEGRLKHADVLRVGRTEMRFVGGAPATASTPSRLAAPGATADRTESSEVLLAGPDEETGYDPARAAPDATRGPGIDFRERVRRLEKRVLELEQDRARFAAENAVLKRALDQAGLWDRAAQRAIPAAARGAPTAATTATTAGTEAPGAFATAWIGVGAVGAALVAAWKACGRTRGATIAADPGAAGRDAARLREAATGAERVFLCASLDELTASSLDALLSAFGGGATRTVVGAFLMLPPADDAAAAEAASAAYDALRSAAEAGRLRGVVLRPAGPVSEAVAVFDAALRAPSAPLQGSVAVTADDVRAVLDAGGYVVPSVASVDAADPEGVEAAARRAFNVSALVPFAPASRARAAAAWFRIASGPSASDRRWTARLEAALDGAAGILPQARLRRGLYQGGIGIVAGALVGGLTLPARAFGDAP